MGRYAAKEEQAQAVSLVEVGWRVWLYRLIIPQAGTRHPPESQAHGEGVSHRRVSTPSLNAHFKVLDEHL